LATSPPAASCIVANATMKFIIGLNSLSIRESADLSFCNDRLLTNYVACGKKGLVRKEVIVAPIESLDQYSGDIV